MSVQVREITCVSITCVSMEHVWILWVIMNVCALQCTLAMTAVKEV